MRVVVAAFALVMQAGAFAQTYPDHPVRMLVGFPPGGGADVVDEGEQKLFGDTVRYELLCRTHYRNYDLGT